MHGDGGQQTRNGVAGGGVEIGCQHTQVAEMIARVHHQGFDVEGGLRGGHVDHQSAAHPPDDVHGVGEGGHRGTRLRHQQRDQLVGAAILDKPAEQIRDVRDLLRGRGDEMRAQPGAEIQHTSVGLGGGHRVAEIAELDPPDVQHRHPAGQ